MAQNRTAHEEQDKAKNRKQCQHVLSGQGHGSRSATLSPSMDDALMINRVDDQVKLSVDVVPHHRPQQCVCLQRKRGPGLYRANRVPGGRGRGPPRMRNGRLDVAPETHPKLQKVIGRNITIAIEVEDYVRAGERQPNLNEVIGRYSAIPIRIAEEAEQTIGGCAD